MAEAPGMYIYISSSDGHGLVAHSPSSRMPSGTNKANLPFVGELLHGDSCLPLAVAELRTCCALLCDVLVSPEKQCSWFFTIWSAGNGDAS